MVYSNDVFERKVDNLSYKYSHLIDLKYTISGEEFAKRIENDSPDDIETINFVKKYIDFTTKSGYKIYFVYKFD